MDQRIDNIALPLLALTYGALGVASLYVSLFVSDGWEVMGTVFTGGLMSGFVFLVASMVLVVATVQLKKGGDSLVFAYVGTGIGTLMLVVQTLLVLGDAFGSLIGMEDLEGWALLDSIDPTMAVGLIALGLLISYRRRIMAETGGAETC